MWPLKWGAKFAILGFGFALGAGSANATTIITFTEAAVEGQNVDINVVLDPGVQRLEADQATPETGRVLLSFPEPFPLEDLSAWAVLLESTSPLRVSDYVLLNVTHRPATQDVRVLIGFQSDPFTFAAFQFPPAVVRPRGVLETGTEQDLSGSFFRVQGGLAVNVPLICPTCQTPFLTVKARSDAPEPVPEPSTLLVFGIALAGLGGIPWRRHRAAATASGRARAPVAPLP